MSGFRSKARLADAILRVEKDPTRIIDLVREFVEANVPGEGKEFANAILDFIALIPPERVTLILELLQLVLDIVGLFPGLGEPLDALNAAISLGREEYLSAGLSAASMVPVVGAIPGAGKALRRINVIIKFADALPAGIRGVLLDLLAGLKDELASLASRKISDIVNGLKRRINEATDRLRMAAKKKDDAPRPGGAGKKKASSNSPKEDAIPAAPPPGKPKPKPDPLNKTPAQKPNGGDSSSDAMEPAEVGTSPTTEVASRVIAGNIELGKLIKDVARSKIGPAQKVEALIEGSAKISGITFERISNIPGTEAVFLGKPGPNGTPLLAVLKDGRVLEGSKELGLIKDPSAATTGFRINVSKLREKR